MLRKITRYHKRLRYTYMKVTAGILFLAALFLPSYTKWEEEEENLFTIYLNGESVGVVSEKARAEELLQEARRELVSDSEELVFIDVNMSLEGKSVLWAKLDEEDEIKERMSEILKENIKETMRRSYVVKVNNYMVNLGSMEEVEMLLQTAVDKYDSEDKYIVELSHAGNREFNVMTAKITERVDQEEAEAVSGIPVVKGGMEKVIDDIFANVVPVKEMDLQDYDKGLISMSFTEEVEIVEAYLDMAQLTPLGQAIEEVIKEQEVNSVYVVESGDTLSQIAMKVNIPMDKLVEMNDTLDTVNSIIRVGQELIITIPEPELSVERQEQVYYDEVYEADIIYIPRDDWYTDQTRTVVEPHAGYRKVVAIVTYRNDKEVSREIIMEEIIAEAVARQVERGTKTPPRYIKPVSKGILTSGFGYRPRPNVAGATANHLGVDWAVPTGTSVYASCAGTVRKAGWGGGYGYVIYIDHEDGKQTRYAHLSKILVSVGQTVSQGQKIALSGSTGASTGPHVHFEILVGGVQKNPLNYLEYY